MRRYVWWPMNLQSGGTVEAVTMYVHPARHHRGRKVRFAPLGGKRGRMIEVPIGEATIRVWLESSYLETIFSDGKKVGSTPDHEHDRDIAQRYGYGDDATALWLDHDPAHSFLAIKHGRYVSPTLWAVAHPDDVGIASWEEQAEEEAAVLDFQQFVQTGDNWRGFPQEWSDEFSELRKKLRVADRK